MEKLLLGGLFLLSSLIPSKITDSPPNIAPDVPKIAQEATSSPEWIKERISFYADYYGVSEITLRNVVGCESGFNPEAVGDYGTSVGLVQIHLPAHPDITKENAKDIEFSLDLLARKIKEGSGNLWTCYRMN